MTNLNRIKKENNFHSKKDYNSAILERTRKNKAMIGFSSLTVGGGVFLGLLVPGLLPVVMAGAPILAMSTNVVMSAVAGSALGGVHYAVNRKEGKLRKYTKRASKGFRYKFDAELDDAHHDRNLRKSDKQLNKSKAVYDHYFNKLEALKQKNLRLIQNGASASTLERNNKKIKQLEEGLAKLNKSYEIAQSLYNEDHARLMGQNAGGNGTSVVAPAKPKTENENDNQKSTSSSNDNSQSQNEKQKGRNPFTGKLRFGGPSKIVIGNNEATRKLKSMLNLATPTLEENARYYEAKFVFDKYTPTRVTTDREPVEEGTEMTDEIIAKQEQKALVSQIFDDMDYNFLEYENFVNDASYNLPIKNGKNIIKIEFEDPALDITYELNDYQKSLTKPLFIMTSLVDLLQTKNCGAFKISNTMVDAEGKKIDTALNYEIEVDDLKSAVQARNMIYTRMLVYMYEAQKTAYDMDITSNVSGLDIIKKACDLSIPKAEKQEENIIEDLALALGTDSKTLQAEEFYNVQFLKNQQKVEEETKEPEIIDTKSVDVLPC